MFDRRSVSFVSITQSFNTSSGMGRLTFNVLLSIARFEREATARGDGCNGLQHLGQAAGFPAGRFRGGR